MTPSPRSQGGASEVVWDRSARDRTALKKAMVGLGHTGIVWDDSRYFRGTCEHGCTGILIEGVHSYGTGLDKCPASSSSEGSPGDA